MPRRRFLVSYTLALVSTGIVGLDQQTPFPLSDQSHDRPSWSTLPIPNPTKSFWVDTPGSNPLAREGSTGPLGFGDEEIDVCVIGSGITGISAVYHLQRFFGTQGDSEDERKVVVLEAREFCSGATGRNGGHLTRNPFNGYATRERLYGQENARKSYLLEDYVSSSITDLIYSHGWSDTVDLVNGGHITVFLDEEEERHALVDHQDAKEGGLKLKDVRFLDKQMMQNAYGINHSGVFFPSYNLWPLKFVSNLYNLSASANPRVKVKLHTLTPVTAISSSHSSSSAPSNQDTRWIVSTPRGNLSCKTVLHATNAYSSFLLPQFSNRIIPTRGQMFVVRAKASLERLKRHSWDANQGYEYWFARPEGKDKHGKEYQPPLVLLGGGRDTADPGLDQHTMDECLFEEGRDAEMEWTGIMGYTHKGAPFVGPVEGLDGQYIAAGFTGHGMPRTYAAEAVSGMIVANLMEPEWKAPEWLPEHYLTSWRH
ncbi:Gamma-glutamylputrescine oxidoreductase [Leucoagaricus sp. SymC.cos]|nr:Gamma-glutamylputrescine oxidoreductase [Leucoagaricus sp. SymC.cos]